jgi:hypothetical protein
METAETTSVLLGAQLQQERGFSAPMFRSRGVGSSWSVQHERQTTVSLTSSTTSLAATAAWQASVFNAESSQVRRSSWEREALTDSLRQLELPSIITITFIFQLLLSLFLFSIGAAGGCILSQWPPSVVLK